MQSSELIEMLRAELDSIKNAIQEQIRTIRDVSQTANEARKEIPVRISELRIQENEKTESRTYQKKQHRQQVILTWGTWLAFVAAAIYAGISANQLLTMHKTYGEIQRQTTLMWDETIGTQGAVLEFTPNLALAQNFSEVPVLSYGLKALPGRATAKHIVVALTVQRIKLPTKESIGTPIRCDLSVPQLAGTAETSFEYAAKICELPHLNQSTADEIMFTRQSVTITGSLSYDNGFGQIIVEPVCQTFLGYRYKGEEKSPNGSVNTYSGEDRSFHPCDDFDRVFRRAMRGKKKYGDNYTPQIQP